jgi:hypothetical protein
VVGVLAHEPAQRCLQHSLQQQQQQQQRVGALSIMAAGKCHVTALLHSILNYDTIAKRLNSITWKEPSVLSRREAIW